MGETTFGTVATHTDRFVVLPGLVVPNGLLEDTIGGTFNIDAADLTPGWPRLRNYASLLSPEEGWIETGMLRIGQASEQPTFRNGLIIVWKIDEPAGGVGAVEAGARRSGLVERGKAVSGRLSGQPQQASDDGPGWGGSAS